MKTKTEIAELIHGPFDGSHIPLATGAIQWPPFLRIPLTARPVYRDNPSRAVYRRDPLACGDMRYVFHGYSRDVAED